jgi:hypothetical protein
MQLSALVPFGHCPCKKKLMMLLFTSLYLSLYILSLFAIPSVHKKDATTASNLSRVSLTKFVVNNISVYISKKFITKIYSITIVMVLILFYELLFTSLYLSLYILSLFAIPSVHKKDATTVSNLSRVSLTKFVVNNISVYISKKIYHKNIFYNYCNGTYFVL